MKSKSVIGILITVCLAALLCFAVPAMAAQNSPTGATSSNLGDYNYVYDRWATPINSYLVSNDDGTLTRVEFVGQQVVVETYNDGHSLVNDLAIDAELPLFGGFYAGSTHNFLVFGKENPTEDDNAEVMRVVCYTKDWIRVGSASLRGANTTIPFDAGSLRFAECDGYLYIRTSHEMYTSEDGRNHQANVMLNIRISDMTITDSFTKVMNVNYGYVSHSFNQFLAVDGKDLLAVDHGDAHPRSVVLFKYNAPAGQDSFMKAAYQQVNGGFRYAYVNYVDVLPIAGATGANDTGVSLGGFEVSDTAYLIAGTTVSHEGDYDLYGQRNIFITVTSKNDFSQEGTTIRYLTDHPQDAGVTLGNPHFVKVSNHRYAVLWTEQSGDDATLCYCFVDGNGQLNSKVYSTSGVLSDCKPVVSGNKLVWYATNASAPAFFTIDLNAPETVTHDHIYTYDYADYPGYDYDGKLVSECTVCGEKGAEVIVPAIKNKDQYVLVQYSDEPTCNNIGYAWYRWKNANLYSVTDYMFGTQVEPLGHSYEAVVTAPTCAAGGYTTYTCSICGDSYVSDQTAALAHEAVTYSFVNNVHTFTCTTCGQVAFTKTATDGKKFNINTAAPVLSDDIVMKYGVTIPAGFENPYMVFDFNGESFLVEEYDIDASNGRYVFKFPGINPQKMGDNICSTLYATVDGYEVSLQFANYSLLAYCDNQLKKSNLSATLRTQLSDVLVYGEKTQLVTGYKTDALVTTLLSPTSTLTPSTFPDSLDESLNLQKVLGDADARVYYSAVNLSLGSKMAVRLTVVCNDTSLFTYKVNISGREYTYTGEDLVPVDGSSNKYYLYFNQMKATELDQKITFTIWEGDTQISDTIEYSVYTYVLKNYNNSKLDENTRNLLKAIYNYGETTKLK